MATIKVSTPIVVPLVLAHIYINWVYNFWVKIEEQIREFFTHILVNSFFNRKTHIVSGQSKKHIAFYCCPLEKTILVDLDSNVFFWILYTFAMVIQKHSFKLLNSECFAMC